jgi:hypothetical protein
MHNVPRPRPPAAAKEVSISMVGLFAIERKRTRRIDRPAAGRPNWRKDL